MLNSSQDSTVGAEDGSLEEPSPNNPNFLRRPLGQLIGETLVPIPKGLARNSDEPESFGMRGRDGERVGVAVGTGRLGIPPPVSAIYLYR